MSVDVGDALGNNCESCLDVSDKAYRRSTKMQTFFPALSQPIISMLYRRGDEVTAAAYAYLHSKND